MYKTTFYSILITIVFLSLTAFIPVQNESIQTFILVRHAEKIDDSFDPDLSSVGYQRAENLAGILSFVVPDVIYTSDYIRTKETIRPVADRLNLEPVIYDPKSQKRWVKTLIQNKDHQTVLISGHSNTIPELATLLLNREHFTENFDESDYGNLIIITRSNDETSILHLRY